MRRDLWWSCPQPFQRIPGMYLSWACSLWGGLFGDTLPFKQDVGGIASLIYSQWPMNRHFMFTPLQNKSHGTWIGTQQKKYSQDKSSWMAPAVDDKQLKPRVWNQSRNWSLKVECPQKQFWWLPYPMCYVIVCPLAIMVVMWVLMYTDEVGSSKGGGM